VVSSYPGQYRGDATLSRRIRQECCTRTPRHPHA
jgi:hypothetical protein